MIAGTVYRNKTDWVVVKPPTCRVLSVGNQKFYLSLPYTILHARYRRAYGSVGVRIATSRRPITNITTDVVDVMPLPNMHELAYVCGLSASGFSESKIINLFGSVWSSWWTDAWQYAAIADYYRDFRYNAPNSFISEMLKRAGVRFSPWAAEAAQPSSLLFPAWEKLSKKDPGFILTMPFRSHGKTVREFVEVVK